MPSLRCLNRPLWTFWRQIVKTWFEVIRTKLTQRSRDGVTRKFLILWFRSGEARQSCLLESISSRLTPLESPLYYHSDFRKTFFGSSKIGNEILPNFDPLLLSDRMSCHLSSCMPIELGQGFILSWKVETEGNGNIYRHAPTLWPKTHFGRI
jgi:hypothetical protein